jgi:hypothetical protein
VVFLLPVHCALPSSCSHRPSRLVADEERAGGQQREREQLEGRKSKRKCGVYCVMPMAPLALLPACAATKIPGSEQCTEMHRCLGGCLDLVALMGALAGGCLGGWWVPLACKWPCDQGACSVILASVRSHNLRQRIAPTAAPDWPHGLQHQAPPRHP